MSISAHECGSRLFVFLVLSSKGARLLSCPMRPSAGSLRVSLPTLISASTMLGHEMEDRAPIREAQDGALADSLRDCTATAAGDVPAHAFLLGAFDVLVTASEGQNRFHILELNGSGLGGLTNIGEGAILAIMDEFRRVASTITEEQPLVLVPATGNDLPGERPRSRLLYEKLLLADALCDGLRERHGGAQVATLARLGSGEHRDGGPLVALGYGQELVRSTDVEDERPRLFGRTVTAAINDRLAARLVKKGVGRSALLGVNGAFSFTADKGRTYELLNDFLDHTDHPLVAPVGIVRRAHNREELEAELDHQAHDGRAVVIKPQATGRGDGIEFFLGPEEPSKRRARLDASIAAMEEYYVGGPFPYTITDFIDGRTISRADHRCDGRKFELRIVVYREGPRFCAYPSIAKVCPTRYDPAALSREMLINNISSPTSTAERTRIGRMLPLCNPEILSLLGIAEEDLAALCRFATAFTKHVAAQSVASPP